MTRPAAVIAAILLTIVSVGAHRQPSSAAVSVWQAGVERTDRTVVRAVEFSLLGSGFEPSSVAKICLTGQPCVRTTTDESGAFSQPFTLYYDGTYTINVYQGAGADLPPLVYTGSLEVVEP